VCAGIVRGYRVQYVAVDDVGDAVEDTSRVVDVANNSRMEAVVGGLQADCLYQFDMWAYTRRTEGQRTRQRRVKTLGAGRLQLTTYHNKQWLTCCSRQMCLFVDLIR